MRAVKLLKYDVVLEDGEWVVIRNANGKEARVPATWVTVKGGVAEAASQTKQLRLDGADWE